MSALRTIDVTQAPGSGGQVQVPRSYMPEMDRALLDGSPRILEFPASSGSFIPGTTSQILIPPTMNRYILGGSSYLNFDFALNAVTVGGTITATAGVSYFTGGPAKSAAALIDRITVSAAGTTIADISNYYIWHNIVLCHTSNQDYLATAAITENAFQALDYYTAAGTYTMPTLNVALPLAVGVFNTTKAFPLWAFNGPIQINIYWNSYARSIGFAPLRTDNTDAAPTAITMSSTGWAGSNLSFRCNCVDVDPEYIFEQKKQMAAGKLLVYQYDQANSMQTNAGSASINFGINTSSLLAVLGCQLMTNDASQIANAPAETVGGLAGSTTCYYQGSWGYSANDVDGIRVFRDGTQMTSFPLCMGGRDDAFPVLCDTLGVLFSTSNGTLVRHIDPRQKVPSSTANYRADCGVAVDATGGPRRFALAPLWGMGTVRGGSVFAPTAFVWGVPSRKCSDDNISNQGVYCQQLQLVVDRSTTGNTAGTHYLFTIFSSAFAVDASGNCVVKR